MLAANQLPATQLSASKFPAKLLVYQRRHKPSIQSVSLPSQQADICLHQESSAGLSQISNFQDDVLATVQEHSAENSSIPCDVLANVQEHFAENSNILGDVLANDQEHPLTASKSYLFPVSQESQVSINSSSVGFQGLSISSNTSTTSSSQKQLQSVSSFLIANGNTGAQKSYASLVSGLRMGCHPMLTRSKTGFLKNKKGT
ncbi:hypothetical protein V6N11_013076 [Hibiscus sabdariffa]|uniref:Uncharacterized protein n=2 Tax=Hibiscus sabdariffa TaxID=183260 RepID=A0ABR2DIC0_9ROSI